MEERPIFEEVMSSQVEVLEAEQRLHRLEAQLGENPTEAQLAAAGRARDAYEALGGYTIEAKVRSVLFGLGFKEGDLARATSEFSGGWQMRIALAKLLIRNPEVLLLDEPTNHLDLESVRWLEGFLRGYAGTVVVVSHDRAFMDNMVDRVAEIDRGQVTLYKGNYSAYLKAREERIERLRAEAAKQAEEVAHMEAFIERFRYKPSKAKQVQDRVKKLEKMERIEVPAEKKTVHFNFKQPPRTGEVVVAARGLVKRYGEKRVYDGQDFTLYRGDKVALVGSQRRRQVHASEDGGRGAGARRGQHRVRRARDQDLLRAAPAGRTASGQHRVRGTGPRGAGLDRESGAHASGSVPVHGRRGGEEGERAFGRREEPARAGEDAGGAPPASVPGRADEPFGHRERRHSGTGPEGVRGHHPVHHARPAPHPGRGQPHRGSDAGTCGELRRRLRLLPVQERAAGRPGSRGSLAGGRGAGGGRPRARCRRRGAGRRRRRGRQGGAGQGQGRRDGREGDCRRAGRPAQGRRHAGRADGAARQRAEDQGAEAPRGRGAQTAPTPC